MSRFHDGTLQTARVMLTAAEIKALAATQKTLVPAQGANRVIVLESALLQLHDDGTDYDDAAGDGNLDIKYVDGDGTKAVTSIEADGFIDATAEAFAVAPPIVVASGTVAQLENVPLVLDNDGDEFTTGTRTMTVHISYRVYDV